LYRQNGGGTLGVLTESVGRVLAEKNSLVEIVSVSGYPDESNNNFAEVSPDFKPSDHKTSFRTNIYNLSRSLSRSSSIGLGKSKEGSKSAEATDEAEEITPFACVWLAVKLDSQLYMNPVKLHGLLELKAPEVWNVSIIIFTSLLIILIIPICLLFPP